MSEVKRFVAAFASVNESDDGNYVLFDDLDRVTADRDAALAELAWQESDNAELRKRLDVLEGLLLTSLVAMNRIYSAGRDFIVGAGSDCDSVELMMENDPTAREIRAALKPAEAAKCARCECSTVESCDERGCGFLGSGNGAP